MEITIPNKNVPVILVNDFYAQSELEQMFLEINSLYNSALSSQTTNAAKVNYVLQNNTKGLFLDPSMAKVKLFFILYCIFELIVLILVFYIFYTIFK